MFQVDDNTVDWIVGRVLLVEPSSDLICDSCQGLFRDADRRGVEVVSEPVESFARSVDVLDQINALIAVDEGETVNTSMRLPKALRDAAALAVEHLGIAPSTTMLTVSALRAAPEVAVSEAALEKHFEQHPSARPSLVEVALALAAQDGSPLADRPDIVARAAEEILSRHHDANADDVLLWAEAQQAISA